MLAFVSYARVDKPIVEKTIVEYLSCAGIVPWFDYFLPVGQNWQEVLLDAITKCDVFIYAITQEAIASKWCRWELAKAQEIGKPVIPVLLRKNAEILPELRLKEIQYADFSEGATGEAVARLIGGLYNIRYGANYQPRTSIAGSQTNGEHQLDNDPPHSLAETKRSIDTAQPTDVHSTISRDSKYLLAIRFCWVDILGDIAVQLPIATHLDLHPLYLYDGKITIKVTGNCDRLTEHRGQIEEIILRGLTLRGIKIRALDFDCD